MILRSVLCLVSLIAVLMLTAPEISFAADDKKKVEKPLPKIHDDATFEAATREFRALPFGRADLEYKISLPVDWQPRGTFEGASPDFSKRIVHEIGYYVSPPTGNLLAFLSIQAVQIDHEILAAHWLRSYILAGGYAPDGDIQNFSLTRASGGYIYVLDGKNILTRILVQINGKIAVIARLEMPLQEKGENGFMQKKAVESFSLLYLTEKAIEQPKAFALVDAAKFDFLSSWQAMSPDFRNLNRPSLQIHNKNKNVLEGFIRISAAKRSENTHLNTEIAEVKKFFAEEMKIKFDKLVSSEEYNHNSRYPYGRRETYEVTYSTGKRQRQEARFYVFGNDEWYFFATLITPLESNNFYVWARNTRAFDILIASLR